MRCLVVADLHYSLPQFDWLLAAAPRVRHRDFCRRRARYRIVRRFSRPDRGGEEIPVLLSGMTRVILCSGNHDLDERSAEGEKIARWVGDVRELGIACDGDDLTIGDRASRCAHGGTGAGQGPHRIPAATPPPSGRNAGSGCITRRRRIRDELGRQAVLRRRRTGAMDRAIPPSMVISGHVHQSPFIPDGSWFDRLGDDLGLQHRPAARPPAGLYRARPRRGHRVLDCGRRSATHRPARAFAAAGSRTESPPPWLISLGRIGDPVSHLSASFEEPR